MGNSLAFTRSNFLKTNEISHKVHSGEICGCKKVQGSYDVRMSGPLLATLGRQGKGISDLWSLSLP